MRTARWRHGVIPLLAIFLIGAADGGASLVDAVKQNDKERMRTLLKDRSNVNVASPDGTTALHWASYRDDVESAELLIRAGANVNAATDLGVTPLWLSSLNGSAAMTQRLLQAGANPNLALLAGETPLMAASQSGSAAATEQLIAKGANVNARGTRDQTPLMWAAAQKHPEVVKVLLAHGADLNARSAVWSEVMAVPPHGVRENNRETPHGKFTALLFAVREGDLASAAVLVAAGANVNDEDADGVSATAFAAHGGYREIVELLLEKGANANAMSAFAPLHAAIMRRDEKMVAALLAHGADPNAPVRHWTPTRRQSDDFNFPPEFVGATPFWLAARVAEPNLMRLLAQRGADPKVIQRADYPIESTTSATGYGRRQEQTTALMAALGMGGGRPWQIGPVPMLVGPLPPAAETQAHMLEAVKVAAELGADVNATGIDGRTALDFAQTRKYSAIVEFLLAHGAKPGAPARTARP